jgi:hypothetical protein
MKYRFSWNQWDNNEICLTDISLLFVIKQPNGLLCINQFLFHGNTIKVNHVSMDAVALNFIILARTYDIQFYYTFNKTLCWFFDMPKTRQI